MTAIIPVTLPRFAPPKYTAYHHRSAPLQRYLHQQRWSSSSGSGGGGARDPRRFKEPMSRKTLAGTAVLGAGLLGFMYYLKRKKETG